jgi:hypothetical protein
MKGIGVVYLSGRVVFLQHRGGAFQMFVKIFPNLIISLWSLSKQTLAIINRLKFIVNICFYILTVFVFVSKNILFKNTKRCCCLVVQQIQYTYIHLGTTVNIYYM